MTPLLADVVVSTFAVALTWLLLGLLVGGLGLLVCRTFVGDMPWTAPLWVGLAVLLAYLQLWNVFFAVTWASWAVPLAAAAAGLALRLCGRPRLQLGRRPLLAAGAAALAVLWLANHALAKAADYDLGLYHLNLIEYAKRYATIPGLANLQTRFGASDPHLLLVSFLDRGPWAGAGWHLVDGFLVSLLAFELAARLARRPGGAPSFTRRLALFLVPATVVVVGGNMPFRLSSPNLDLACFVLVATGMLYLADCVEGGVRPAAALTAVAALAAASATRPLYWLMTAFACASLLVLLRRAVTPARRSASLLALPAALLAGAAVRQAILSGYPFFPLAAAGLPVDWRVPPSIVGYANRWTSSWARWPGHGPDEVLASWHWLRAFWLPAQEKALDVVAPLALLACLPPALVAGRRDTSRAARTRPMLAIVAPSVATLVLWFVAAPDPRFALAPLWLVPAALAAWALPPAVRVPLPAAAVGLGGAAGLAALFVLEPGWFLPAALLLPVYLLGVLWVVRRPAWAPPVAAAVALAATGAVSGVIVYRQPHHLFSASASGPFGAAEEEVPQTVPSRTAGGLHLVEPVGVETGSDQCFAILVCTAELVDPVLHDRLERLHLRGSGVGSGFSVEARAAQPAPTRRQDR